MRGSVSPIVDARRTASCRVESVRLTQGNSTSILNIYDPHLWVLYEGYRYYSKCNELCLIG